MQNLELCRTNMQVQFDEWYNNLHSRGASGLSSMQAHSSVYSSSQVAEDKPSNDDRFSKVNQNSSQAKHNSEENNNSHQQRKDDIDDVNEDIAAFYQAKEAMLKRRQNS